MTIQLRPYQHNAVEGVFEYWRTDGGNPILVLPTGAGKSVIQAEIIDIVLKNWRTMRIGCITHRAELIAQNHEAFCRISPLAPSGIYSAGIGRRDTHAQVLFAGIQSIYNKIHKTGAFDLIIVDEAQLISRKSEGMYNQFFEANRKCLPHMRVLGLSATPYRTDSGMLHEGEDALFDGIAYEVGVGFLIENGFLTRPTTKATDAVLSTDGVALRGGEFAAKELDEKVNTDALNDMVAAEILQKGADRKSWLTFAVSINHAEELNARFCAAGIVSCVVTGSTPKDERAQILEDFKAGNIQSVCNVDVLTTGFDAPNVDLINFCRATNSPGLYSQIIGRGLRLHPDKENVLVLDFGQNILRHGPVDNITPPKKGKRKNPGDAPMKTCPGPGGPELLSEGQDSACGAILSPATRECPECGYEFPIEEREVKIDKKAFDGEIMQKEIKPLWVVPTLWTFAPHGSPNPAKPDTLKVSYICTQNMSVQEYLCFNHPPTSFPRRKADQWWSQHGGQFPAPVDVAQAVARQGELRRPSEVLIKMEGRYANIANRRFENSLGQLEAAL